MITTELDPPLFLPPPESPRSEGLHVSSIIRCIAMENSILNVETREDLSLVDYREITDPVAILRMNIGLAWESHYLPNILSPSIDVIDHPGEMYVDGIYMTHDGESVSMVAKDQMSLVVHETKATYKSTRRLQDMDTQWMWMSQIKAYCRGLGTRFAELHVLFLAGDYSYPISPLLKRWRIEFTQDEIDSNWSLLKDYAEFRLGREL